MLFFVPRARITRKHQPQTDLSLWKISKVPCDTLLRLATYKNQILTLYKTVTRCEHVLGGKRASKYFVANLGSNY